MSVMFGPVGGDLADMQPLGWVASDGLISSDETPDAFVLPERITETFTFDLRLKGPRARQPWQLYEDHYTHPRQVLHNGRKSR